MYIHTDIPHTKTCVCVLFYHEAALILNLHTSPRKKKKNLFKLNTIKTPLCTNNSVAYTFITSFPCDNILQEKIKIKK